MAEHDAIRECGQFGCSEKAAFRYTWPGSNEAGACIEHASKAVQLANVIGFRLQLIPLTVPPLAEDPPRG